MEVFEHVPAELQSLILEYETLAELIEAGVPLSYSILISVVRSALGDTFVREWEPDLIDSLDIDVTESKSEAYTALLVLGRLDPSHFQISHHAYFARQSRIFKQLIYPLLISLLNQADSSTRDIVLSSLVSYESHTEAANSGLDVLYELAHSEVLSYISKVRLIFVNPSFILNHMHEIAVTELCVYTAMETNNLILVEAFVRRLGCEDNMIMVQAAGSSTYDPNLDRLHQLGACLDRRAPSMRPLLQDAIALSERL